MMVQNTRHFLLLIAGAGFASVAFPCSIFMEGDGISNVRMVLDADAIVRATAVNYAVKGLQVRFQVTETIRGAAMKEVILPGMLMNSDDFNDRQPPYDFVRPGGRGGNCFANSYREGAQFLLFLKKGKGGNLTVNWDPLAPVNEQLHSEDDPWLLWVREQARKSGKGAAR